MEEHGHFLHQKKQLDPQAKVEDPEDHSPEPPVPKAVRGEEVGRVKDEGQTYLDRPMWCIPICLLCTC